MAPTTQPIASVAQAVYLNHRGVVCCMTIVGIIEPAKATTIKIFKVFMG
jgi:hypothetical protein